MKLAQQPHDMTQFTFHMLHEVAIGQYGTCRYITSRLRWVFTVPKHPDHCTNIERVYI